MVRRGDGADGSPVGVPESAEAVALLAGVSRETAHRFERYAALLIDWQQRMNLVGRSTMPDLWNRHFWDSAQLFELLPEGTRTLVDLGSGAGFPGLVLAMMGVPDVHLIEADSRKAAFLRTVSRETGTGVTIHGARIEAVTPFVADVVTARALAPLPRLIDQARPFLGPRSLSLFPKGQNVESELTEALKTSMMSIDRVPSRSDPRGTILCLREIRRV
ncbi:MAG: 16S rRNA (guanine(527)-N(7))-methyltransferase RsmG [Azospirillaceae bacterium]